VRPAAGAGAAPQLREQQQGGDRHQHQQQQQEQQRQQQQPTSSSHTSSTQSAWEGPSTSDRRLPASQGSRGLRHGLSIGSTRGLSTKKASEESVPQWLFNTIRSVPGKIRSFFARERPRRVVAQRSGASCGRWAQATAACRLPSRATEPPLAPAQAATLRRRRRMMTQQEAPGRRPTPSL
jgi:hypothetical protein